MQVISPNFYDKHNHTLLQTVQQCGQSDMNLNIRGGNPVIVGQIL